MGDPIDRSRRFFGSLGTFGEAFPQLEDITVEWTESGDNVYHYPLSPGRQYEYKVSMKEYGGLIGCSNKMCKQGGFEIDRIAHDMLRNKEAVKEDSKTCVGREGSPRSRACNPCFNSIKYKITLIYKKPLQTS